MTTKLKPHEIRNEIASKLSGYPLEYWGGMIDEAKDEIVAIAQDRGIDAAVDLVCELAN